VKEQSSDCGMRILKKVSGASGMNESHSVPEGIEVSNFNSGGEITVLHPLELVRQIRKLSQNPIVATDVKLTVIAHPKIELGFLCFSF
jgi:hypothetical protein